MVYGMKEHKFYITYLFVAINVFVFFVLEYGIFRNSIISLLEWGGNYAPAVVEDQQYYRLLTSMFLHVDLEHLLNNMLLLFYIGKLLESLFGKLWYSFLYFFAGIVAGLCSIVYNTHIGQARLCVGASGAVFGLTGAMAYFIIWKKGKIAQISKRQMLLMVIFSLYGGFVEQNVDNTAHIGGLVAGIIFVFLYSLLPIGKKEKKKQEGMTS